MTTDVLFRGVYPADRAAALSGVPKSTVYYWASHGVLTPSLRPDRPKIWTYADVLALRIIYWLRHDKPISDGGRDAAVSTAVFQAKRWEDDPRLPASSMQKVRKALLAIRDQGKEIWHEDLHVLVDRRGDVLVRTPDGIWKGTPAGQSVVEDTLDVLAEFRSAPGLVGPNLSRPRPHLRIIPGKLAGEPHVEHTRIKSRSMFSLLNEGLAKYQVLRLYPELTTEAVEECWDLENSLSLYSAAA